MALMLVRLTTLGAARVHSGATDLPDLPAQRLRFALLLYLGVERDVAREEVVAMFWPDRDTARGKHALRQMLYELRQVLGEAWIDMRRDRIVVSAAVDAVEFESAMEGGRLTDALALYGGPFLHGFSLDNRSFEAWADRRRGHLARLHRRLQRDHIAALVAAGQADDALNAARHWVELDPLDDEAAHTLIERLAAAGQRTAALQYYDNYVRQLDAELEVEPLEETQALVASIRNGEAVQPGLPSPGADAAAAHAGSERRGVDAAVELKTPASPSVTSGPTTGASALPGPSLDGHASQQGTAVDRRSVRMPLRRRPREIWKAASLARRSVAVALLVVLVSVIGYESQRSSAEALVDRRIVVAMMPINDNSTDGSLLHLAESLTADLTSAIARSGLGVRSADAVRELRSRGVSENEIGTKLGADYMVGGRVNRSGDLVTAFIDLLDGDGMVLQSQTIERPFSAIRNLNQAVAEVMERFLRSELRVPIHVRFAHSGASNDSAFRLVGHAREMQKVAGFVLEAGQLPEALAHLAEVDSLFGLAASMDPDWPEPVVLRGRNLEGRAFIAKRLMGDTVLARQLLEQALLIADQAEQLGSDNAEVHALRGTVLYQLADMAGQSAPSVTAAFDRAEDELKRATQLDPSNQGAWLRLSDIQFNAGRYGEALHSAEEGYRLDPAGPRSGGFLYRLWAIEFETGDDLAADGWCGQLWGNEESLPGLYCTLVLQAWGGKSIPVDPAAARRAMEHIQKSDLRIQPEIGPRFQTLLAAVYARAGQPDSARATLNRVETADVGVLWLRAGVHALLGEDAVAVELLSRYMEADPLQGPRVARSRPFWDLGTRMDLDALIASRTTLASGGRHPSAGLGRLGAESAGGPTH
jgi:DNA-binding SARP family transcriptional activator/TolB-like protein